MVQIDKELALTLNWEEIRATIIAKRFKLLVSLRSPQTINEHRFFHKLRSSNLE